MLKLMTEKIKIKLNVAGRVYPLTVNSDREVVLQRAAGKVQEVIKSLEQNYAVSDKQDVLAMSLLQFATRLEDLKYDSRQYEESLEKIKSMSTIIETELL
jgi:cell division protein ZapA